ncbi:MAG: TIGR04282 family arsenosugar biosynthesis glycosyltransferase [Finegoldia sp.]|nr:TIGR04282 family arsenosugar biosynthesis glycosyltransferase [Finegoldia sp.]
MDAVILMTKIPNVNNTKTRLKTILSPSQRVNLSYGLIDNILNILKDYKVILALTPDNLIDDFKKDYDYEIIPQVPGNEGDKMEGAIETVLAMGYDKVVLIGSDIVNFDEEIFKDAFKALDDKEVVYSPTEDGGYSLIGMKKPHRELFADLKYSHKDVSKDLFDLITENNLSVKVLRKTRDIDIDLDFVTYLTGEDEVKLIGRGEYNANYLIKDDYLVRIALGSQMHLDDQIGYEYKALKFLEKSQVTPKAYGLYTDELSGASYLTEEYLHGRVLDYQRDLDTAAYLLAKVHALDSSGTDFIRAEKPFEMMFEEFVEMFGHYRAWDKKDETVEEKISSMLDFVKSLGLDSKIENPTLINTELNNGNFIIGNRPENSYIIDWEKPIIGEIEQDLAHFLAPTTTFWKTDIIFDLATMGDFLDKYDSYSKFKVNREKLVKYILFTCLRGITWSAMAYTQYVDRGETEGYTFEKIRGYLDMDFLSKIEAFMDSLHK